MSGVYFLERPCLICRLGTVTAEFVGCYTLSFSCRMCHKAWILDGLSLDSAMDKLFLIAVSGGAVDYSDFDEIAQNTN